MAVPFDTLKLARRLEAAGFSPKQAGDTADAIAEALSQLATKADLAEQGAAFRAEIAAMRAEFRAEIAAVKAEIAALRAEFKADMEILKRDMTIRPGSMIVVATGVLLAAKFFA